MELTPKERELILSRREAAKLDGTLTEEELALVNTGRTLQMEDIKVTNSPERNKEIWAELSRISRESER